MSDILRSPMHAVRALGKVVIGQFKYYFANRWGKGPRKQDIYLCLEVLAAAAPRIAFMSAGFWFEGFVLFGLAWFVGFGVLMLLFAYLVHTPRVSWALRGYLHLCRRRHAGPGYNAAVGMPELPLRTPPLSARAVLSVSTAVRRYRERNGGQGCAHLQGVRGNHIDKGQGRFWLRYRGGLLTRICFFPCLLLRCKQKISDRAEQSFRF